LTPTWLADAATSSAWDAVADAASEPDRPVAVGGDLDAATLAAAYRRGIFPWPPGNAQERAEVHERFGHAVASGAIPNLSPDRPASLDLPWWSPDPRGVIPVGNVHLSRSLRATLRSCGWTTTLNQRFAEVVSQCGQGRASAWITQPVADAYVGLNGLGLAHSVEVWDSEELVGGLYGVLVGRIFVGESMFHRRSDASKIALADLAFRLRHSGAVLVDTQFATPHMRSMGAFEMPREQFLAVLHDVRDAKIQLDTERQAVSRLVS